LDRLLGAADRLDAPLDKRVIEQACATKNLEVGPVEFLAEAFESVGDRFPHYFDVSLSHSTFEHFYSVERAATALAVCMRQGSVGIHNVDFRDHASFGEPLEFLL